LSSALEHVSKNRSKSLDFVFILLIDISRDFIAQAAPGPVKRRIHDDITIVVLSLKNQGS
jgi:hypothetical protein